MTPRVLVVFADATMGGTSRSALLAGRAWAGAGATVSWLALEGVAAAREDLFDAVGPRVTLGEVVWTHHDVVHLHHGVVAGMLDRVLAEVVRSHNESGARLPLITHNIFGVPSGVLDAWEGPMAVNVLGHWSAQQLRSIMLPARPDPSPGVLPNPQDLAFFRPPSEEERVQARQRLGVEPDQVVLGRCGSPIANKWTPDYIDVAKGLRPDQRLVLVGCPPALAEAVAVVPGVTVLDLFADDAALRDFYWACDTFVLAAEQGESFGNVILEALGSGVPVEYLSRTYADNTPWDFQTLPGFTLSATRAAWVARCLAARPLSGPVTDARLQQWFSIEAVGAALVRQYQGLVAGHLTPASTGWPSLPLRRGQRARILLTHNRLVFAARTLVRRGRRARREWKEGVRGTG